MGSGPQQPGAVDLLNNNQFLDRWTWVLVNQSLAYGCQGPGPKHIEIDETDRVYNTLYKRCSRTSEDGDEASKLRLH